MKRLLASCLQSLLATLATAGFMFVFMCAFNLWWAKNCNLGEGHTFWGNYRYCMWMASFMIGGQAAGLLVANSMVAFLRGRLRIVLALASGVLLLLLDYLAPSAGLFPDNTMRLSVYLIAFPLLATAIQWVPGRRIQKTSNQPSHATADSRA